MKRKKLMGWKRMAAFAMALTLTLGDGSSVGVMAAQVSDTKTAATVATEETTGAAAEVTTETESEAASEKETEAESEAASEKETEVESEAASEKVTEAESEAASEKETEAESEAASEKVTETESEAASEKVTETESEEATETEATEAAEETEDVLLGAEVGVSQVIGLEGKEATDGTLKSDDGKVEKEYSYVTIEKQDENSSVSNLAGQTKDYLDAATGLYLYNGVYYSYGSNYSDNTCKLWGKVDKVITDTTKAPERDAATGLYKVDEKYYSYCGSEGSYDTDGNYKVKCYYFNSWDEVVALGKVGTDVDVDAAYGKKVADTDKAVKYYEVNGKDYTYVGSTSVYENGTYTGKALYAYKGSEISFDKKHHSVSWNPVTNKTEISQNGKLYHIGYQVKVNGQDADMTYKADNGQTFEQAAGYISSNVYAAGEKAIYEVRAIYYTQVKDAKTGKCTYTIAKTGDWSAAYEYANEAVVAAKKTVPQVTGVAAVLKSAKKAEVTWAPVAEAAGYTVSYISADTELQVTDDTWKTGKAVVAVVNRKDYGSDEAFEAACEKYEYCDSCDYSTDEDGNEIRTYYISVSNSSVSAAKTYADFSVDGKYTYFTVCAYVNDVNNEYESTVGAYSATVSVVTSDAANVQAVTGLNVENNKDGSFNLKWNPVDDDTNIRIYYSTDASAFDNGAYLYGLANAQTANGSAYVYDDSVNEAYQIAQRTVGFVDVDGSQNELSSSSSDLENLEAGKKYYFVAVTYDNSKYSTNREDITPYQVVKADGSVVKYGKFTDISAASNKVSATREMGQLEKPDIKSEKNSITMTFTGKETGIEIYRKSGKKYKKIATTTSDQYVDKDLKADTTYSYKARTYAYNTVTKKTVYSDYVFFSAETSTDNYIDVKAVKASKNSVKLTWTKVKGATKYEIYRTSTSSTDTNYSKKNGIASNAKWKLVKTVNSAKTVKYTDKKLTSGESYAYKVVAVYKSGKDAKNIFDVAYVTLDLQTPQNVVALLSGSKVKVTWDADKYAKKYEVKYTKYNAQRKAYTDDPVVVSTKKANYTIKGLKAGEYVNVQVRAYNGKKWSSWSRSDSAEMSLANVKSVSAKNVTVKDANGVASAKVKVSWKKVSGAAYYRVYRSTNPATIYNKDTKTYFMPSACTSIVKESNTDENSNYNTVKYDDYKGWSGTIVGTSAIDGGQLQSGVTYYYYVVAYAENGTAVSNGVVKNASVVFNADASITKIKAKKGKTTLTLGKVAGAKKYVVYRSTKAKKGFKQIGTTKKTTYVDKTTKKGKTYYYKVVAVGKNGLKADFETAMSSAKKVKAK